MSADGRQFFGLGDIAISPLFLSCEIIHYGNLIVTSSRLKRSGFFLRKNA